MSDRRRRRGKNKERDRALRLAARIGYTYMRGLERSKSYKPYGYA